MITQIEWFLNYLSRAEKFTMGSGVYFKNIVCPFKGGNAEATHCDTTAFLISKQFGGVVLGYNKIYNPTAKVGIRSTSGGHAFSVCKNLLIDWWAKDISKETDRWIYDLRTESKLITSLYGEKNLWT